MAFYDFLLAMDPLLALSLITLVVTVFVTVVYKYTTDQKRMKELRDEQKRYQKELKSSRSDPDHMMKIQKKAMSSNFEYMKHSFKSTLYTFLPMILLFSWLSANFAYYNISPGESFTITAHFKEGATGQITLDPTPQLGLLSPTTQEINATAVSWTLKGIAGEHFATITYKDDAYKQKILVSEKREYFTPLQTVKDSKLEKITTDLREVRPFGKFSLFGYSPGWLFTYIVLSLLFTMGLRKVMKVY